MGRSARRPFAGRIAKLAEQNRVAIHYGFAEKDGSQLYNTSLCIDGDGNVSANTKNYCSPPGFETDISFPEAGARCLAWAALTLQL